MKDRLASWLGAFLCATIALGAATAFLPKQSLWIDETTQLGGVAAGPGKIVPFLAGKIDLPGVPFDRTPPVSYWVQQTWATIFGNGVTSLRWCGACCIALAAGFVFFAARRISGMWAAIAAGLLFALSPNVSTLGVEIRAYPFFMLVSAAAVWAVTSERLADPKLRHRWLAVVVALSLLASYVQFFGVVLSAAMICGLFIARWRSKEKLRPVLLAASVLLVGLTGLYPFFTSAVGHSDSSGAIRHTGIRDVIRLGYRLIGHPALAVNRLFTVAAFVGATTLIMCAVMAARRSSAVLALVTMLVAGLAASAAAGLVMHSFDATLPHYNCWALPAVFVLLSAGFCSNRKWIGCAGFALLLMAEISSTVRLARYGEHFAHGPYSRLAGEIQRIGPSRVAIIVDGPDTHLAAGVYFPLQFLIGDQLHQFVVLPGAGEPRLRRIIDVNDKTGQAISDLTPAKFIVIQSRDVLSDELSRRLRGGPPEAKPIMPTGPVANWLSSQPGWRETEQKNYFSLVAARVDVFERRAD